MPKRIQMTRRRPWRKDHPDAVIVARPSEWGNPYPLSGFSREEAVKRFRLHAEFMAREAPGWLAPLRGKNLACWCPLDQPCHADVLLELANAELNN